MKGKLLILMGISNSGKSTFAAEKVQNNPQKYTRVNRDDIRSLLYGYTDETVSNYYQRKDVYKLEKEVTKYEDSLIYEGLELGKIVVVDATHLKRSYLERFKYWNVETEIKVFPITLKESLIRNESRNRKVAEEIIQKQYNRFVNLHKDLENNPIDFTPVKLQNLVTKDKCILLDLDGTLCDMAGKRSPYDWKKVGGDLADYSVRSLVQNIDIRNVEIIICTGRDGSCLKETTGWLAENGVFYKHIFIREEGDTRADWVVKEEMWREIAESYFILGLVDDRLQVVRRARALGLKVFNVEHNNF